MSSPWYMGDYYFSFAGRSFNAWSVLWYVGSFAGLIGFFFIISFSEWCCKRRLWYRRNVSSQNASGATATSTSPASPTDPAPPAYDLFAPPSYESIYKDGKDEKPQFDIYVVPVSRDEDLSVPFYHSTGNAGGIPSDNPPTYCTYQNENQNRRSGQDTASDSPPTYSSFQNENRTNETLGTDGVPPYTSTQQYRDEASGGPDVIKESSNTSEDEGVKKSATSYMKNARSQENSNREPLEIQQSARQQSNGETDSRQ